MTLYEEEAKEALDRLPTCWGLVTKKEVERLLHDTWHDSRNVPSVEYGAYDIFFSKKCQKWIHKHYGKWFDVRSTNCNICFTEPHGYNWGPYYEDDQARLSQVLAKYLLGKEVM